MSNQNNLFQAATLKVNTKILEENIRKIKEYAGDNPKILIPVKSNAYGHGMVKISDYLEKNKLCDYLGVAHLSEALELRKNNIKLPILILGQASSKARHLEAIVKYNIDVSVSSIDFLEKLETEAYKQQKTARAHLLVDTGMGRCGVLLPELEELIRRFPAQMYTSLVGVMTHFSVADSLDPEELAYTKQQIANFKKAKEIIAKYYDTGKLIFHTSNSGGCIENRESVFDMIRPGIAVYGYPELDTSIGLKPVMEVVSEITLIKKYPKGHAIGYGRTYKTQKEDEYIAIVPVGYGDGLSRLSSNELKTIVNGEIAPSVGRISMDQFAIKVNSNAKVGDEVVLIGSRNDISFGAKDIAKLVNTISYEVLCNLGNSKRFQHKYI